MIDYFVRCVNEGYPVLFGLNCGYVPYTEDENTGVKSMNNDGVTNHFLVMVGYERTQGVISSLFAIDNASSTTPEIEFLVDSTTKEIYKPKASDNEGTAFSEGYVDDHKYQVTQIRMWKAVKSLYYSSARGVWGAKW